MSIAFFPKASTGEGIIQNGGVNAIVIDSSQNVTIPQNLTVSGTLTSGGVVTSPTGALYPLVSGTAVTISGTPATVDFANVIPATARRVTLSFANINLTAAGNLILQLGTGSTPTWVTTGYVGSASTGSTSASASTSMVLQAANTNTAQVMGNIMLMNPTGNLWVASGTIGDAVINRVNMSGNYVTLAALLTSLRLSTSSGTTFTSGTVNIFWE